MKFLVVLALLALAMAEPEADAQLLYHTGYHPYNYGYAGYPHAYHTYSKREAEAEPEADPALIYSANTLPLTTGLHHSPLVSAAVQTPLVYNSAAVSTGVHQPIVYNSAVQTPLTYHTYGKREAEPEADPALVYTTNTLPLTTAVHQP